MCNVGQTVNVCCSLLLGYSFVVALRFVDLGGFESEP